MPSNGNAGTYAAVARELAVAYAQLPEVDAVAWAGSVQNATADTMSDIDLYIYAHANVPLIARTQIAVPRGTRVEVGNAFFESGDEWDERDSGIHIDVTMRSLEWGEHELNRVLLRHEASLAYTTCIWHNVLTSQTLFDRHGGFAALQAIARQPYPEGLRQAILARNVPLLRTAHGAYLGQIAKAAKRGDLVSVNHRVAALLASYFDILFALNRKPHPGEKRLVALVQRDCPIRPASMETHVTHLLTASGSDLDAVTAHADQLIAGIEALLDQNAISD